MTRLWVRFIHSIGRLRRISDAGMFQQKKRPCREFPTEAKMYGVKGEKPHFEKSLQLLHFYISSNGLPVRQDERNREAD